MNEIITEYVKYLTTECKSHQTSYSYFNNAKEFLNWYEMSFNMKFEKLLRQNVLEYLQYMKMVKRYRNKELNYKTINQKLSSLRKFNEFLVDNGVQNEHVIQPKDYLKVQANYVNPCKVGKQEVERFKQKILLSESPTRNRLYTMVTILEKTGLRIGELLNIKTTDVKLEAGELIIRNGKGSKQRIAYLNSKVVEVIKDYMKGIDKDSEYLFSSRQSGRVSRTVINKEFRKYDAQITPHDLRHYFCTNALENGFGIHEVANLAGHNSAKTTLIYLNPSRKKMKDKMELL